MTVPILRDYQFRLKHETVQAWQRGARNVIQVLPTGGGKSVVVGSIVADDYIDGKKSVVIAHRQELVGQMSLHVARAGVRHNIIAPKNIVSFIVAEHRREFGRSFIDPSSQCSVAGIKTLVSRREELAEWAYQIRRWTIDEAHHVLRSNEWGAGVAMFPNAFGLGVTATPRRADGNGLGAEAEGVFDTMIIGPSMRELIDNCSLTEYEIVIPETDFDVKSLKITDSGDFSPKQMREASKNSHIVGDVVEQYIKWALGKQGIVFATDVQTAHEMAQRFNLFGIPTEAVSSKTPDDVRSEYVRRLRDGRLMLLVNVDLFGEGFDLPAIEVVIMARPTNSLTVYMQQFGRALRLMLGKKFGLIIDLVSNVKLHGLPDKPRYWSLDGIDRRKKRESDPDDMPLTVCRNPLCLKPYERIYRACPYCGYVPVPMGSGRSVEQVDGDLLMLSADVLAKMRAAAVLEMPGAVAERVALAAGEGAGRVAADRQLERFQTQRRLSDAIALWAGHQRASGQTDAQSYRRFFLATGGIDVLSALSLPRVDMERLTADVIRWIG